MGIETIRIQEEAQGAIECPVCAEDVGAGRRVDCGRCETPHHRECLEYMGRCATYGCGGGPSAGAPPSPPEAPTERFPLPSPRRPRTPGWPLVEEVRRRRRVEAFRAELDAAAAGAAAIALCGLALAVVVGAGHGVQGEVLSALVGLVVSLILRVLVAHGRLHG